MRETLTGRRIEGLQQHLSDRSFGIVSVGQQGQPAAARAADDAELAAEIRRQFGLLRLVARTMPDAGHADDPEAEEVAFLVVGPLGDDKGQVRGFLRKMGARFGQSAVLFRPHDASEIVLIRLRPNPPATSSLLSLGAFHPAHIHRYWAELLDREADAKVRTISLLTPISFSRRRATALVQSIGTGFDRPLP